MAPARLERWFEQRTTPIAIRQALREAITFAPQNLLQDPPFSRLDLISCRNLLIYLEPDYQKRVLALFHFALREGGHLFLGPAETIAGADDLFQPISRKWRIFRRLGPTRHDLVGLAADRGKRQEAQAAADAGARIAAARKRRRAAWTEPLLERYAPASVLTDRQLRVHYLRGPTEDYLRPPERRALVQPVTMARDGLAATLRACVRKAIADGQEVSGDGRVRRSTTLAPGQDRRAPAASGTRWRRNAAGELFRARRLA